MLESQATQTPRDLVRQFIVNTFLFGCDNGFEDNASLHATGILDSTGMLELITFLEQAFRVRVADEDLVPENFDTLENIASFLEGKCPDARFCVSTRNDRS
ncbi:MAG: acyl carrier protein [Sedimentisphaerales bacterium]|nr:acyl carrier protein [Sedimentisphaerales bacterium]